MAEIQYLTCPMCGMNKPLRKYVEGDLKLTDIDVETLSFIQIREGGGRGSGFRRIGGLTIDEVKQMPEYQELLEQLREQCNKIIESLLSLS